MKQTMIILMYQILKINRRHENRDNCDNWLHQDTLQTIQFQHNLFQNDILNGNTIPQIKVFAQLLGTIFRFNYQLLWEQNDKSAYVNFFLKHLCE